MNKTLKTIISILISVLFAVGLMYFVTKKMAWNDILDVFNRANYFWVIFAMSFQVIALWIRAVRWNILLEPLNYKISTWNGLLAICFGYLMNLGIPRSGEVARASVSYKKENIPVTAAFGTIVNERIVDLIFMLIALGLTAIFSNKILFAFFDLVSKSSKNEESSSNFSYILIGIFLIISLIFAIFYKKILQLSITQKIITIFKELLVGVLSIFKLKQSLKFILLSLGIWICYFLSGYIMVYALPETSFLTWKDGFYILTISTLGMMIPASGGFGAFHTSLTYGFGALFLAIGLTQEDRKKTGLAYAFLSHTSQIILMLISGLITIPFIFKKDKSTI